MSVTTLKVPVALRDRIAADARATEQTIAKFLAEVLDEWEYRREMEAVGESMRRNPPDETYWAEFSAFDAMGGEVV